MQLNLKRLTLQTSVALALSGCLTSAMAAEETATADSAEREGKAERNSPAERDSKASPLLQSVVVTAQKREESIQEVPITVNAIDGQTLLDANAGLTAGEITRFIPNASAATLDNHGFPRWFLRGIGTGQPSLDNVSPIGYYVDEVYLALYS